MDKLIGTTERRLVTFERPGAAEARRGALDVQHVALHEDSADVPLTVLPLSMRRSRSPGAVVDSLPRAPRPRPSGTIRR